MTFVVTRLSFGILQHLRPLTSCLFTKGIFQYHLWWWWFSDTFRSSSIKIIMIFCFDVVEKCQLERPVHPSCDPHIKSAGILSCHQQLNTIALEVGRNAQVQQFSSTFIAYDVLIAGIKTKLQGYHYDRDCTGGFENYIINFSIIFSLDIAIWFSIAFSPTSEKERGWFDRNILWWR